MLYANADKTKLVPEGSPEAAYAINPADPGEFGGLLKAEHERQEEAEKQAAAQAEGEAREAVQIANPAVELEAGAGEVASTPIAQTDPRRGRRN